MEYHVENSQSREEARGNRSQDPAASGDSRLPEEGHNEYNNDSQQTELFFTQNGELTQLMEEDSNSILSPLPPQSPAHLRMLPWGRLIPCSRHWSAKDAERTGRRDFGGIDLLPKPPSSSPSNISSETTGGTAFLGLENIKPSDIFNEYTLGRSGKCDFVATKPAPEELRSKNIEPAVQNWAHAMISNRHCRIFCMLKSSETSNNPDMEVYIEDTSGNGTFINHTTLLRRGEKRLLHTGDEISLVNATTLRKKIRSKEMLSDLQRHHSFIFVNVFQQQGHQQSTRTQQRQSSLLMPPPPSTRRRGLVDVRAMQNHSITGRRSSPAATAAPTSSLSRRISPRRKEPRRIEEEYDIRDLLGSGTCGQVRRAIHRQTGQEWAVKIIPLTGRNYRQNEADTVATLEAEASILQALDHPYVVQLTDVFVSPGHAIYLVMELLHGGDLFDRIVQKGKYTEVESRRVMRRLLNAVYYLHETKNIVHRDLKPENILCVTRQNHINVKLTDFGLAKSVTDEGLKTFCGTPQYFAPEVLRRRHTVAGRGRYGKQADMWSLGVICYILLSGAPPFDVTDGMEMVVDAKIQFPSDRWSSISDDAKDLVQKLLMADPKSRISVKDACNHEWILTEDGDTHCHPLDDPVVDPNALSRRLLMFESQDESIQYNESQGSFRDMDAVAASNTDARMSIPDSPNSLSTSASHDEPDELESAASEPDQETNNESGSKESDALPDGTAASQVREADETAASEDRDPLEPVSLNARSNNFREIVAKSIEKSESPKEDADGEADHDAAIVPPAAPAPVVVPPTAGNLVTPKGWELTSQASSATLKSTTNKKKSSRGSKKRSKKEDALIESTVKASELSDDEICSQFTDEGDSIVSFDSNAGENGGKAKEGTKKDSPGPKPAEEKGKKSQVQTNKLTSYLTRKIKNKSKKRDAEMDSSPAGRQSKRPRTSLDGAAPMNSPISDEDATRLAGTAASAAAAVKSKPGSPKSPISSSKHTGGKQTKLSNWFHKKET